MSEVLDYGGDDGIDEELTSEVIVRFRDGSTFSWNSETIKREVIEVLNELGIGEEDQNRDLLVEMATKVGQAIMQSLLPKDAREITIIDKQGAQSRLTTKVSPRDD